MAVQQRELTLEAFLKRPERKPALEFVGGRVTQKVPPKAKHSVLQFQMAARLNRFSEPPKLAFAFPELRATFAGASVVPDVSVFVWDRIARDAVGEPLDDVFLPPDIAVEIRSPSQRARVGSERCLWYVENGVQIAVLVDPIARSVSLFRPGTDPLVLQGDAEINLGEVLPGFQLTVRELFDSLKLV